MKRCGSCYSHDIYGPEYVKGLLKFACINCGHMTLYARIIDIDTKIIREIGRKNKVE